MKPEEFWQNFKLGEEQEIAANFIYDALRNFHEMETISVEREIFPVLYNLSIGVERLLKVAITLVEFGKNTNHRQFEESLKTHNHPELLSRLEDNKQVNLGSVQTEFLDILYRFYKLHRYDRFSFGSLQRLGEDKEILQNFFHKHLGIDITENFPITAVWNTFQIKKFFGKVVKKITKELYRIIKEEAKRKNIYTDEISGSDSKAAKVLWGDDDLHFEDEDRVIIELLIYFLHTNESTLIDVIKDIDPLDLDPGSSKRYLEVLLSNKARYRSDVLDEIECLYQEEVSDAGERLKLIDAIKDPNVYFSHTD